ncbi:hypothetical protein [Acidocella facilis]|uniref:hypothetical protein n=1 Tax=Acidocella facilis TaxID=525 RepID=UPI001F2C214D|nr:hypothetical protein [Acidocella facilis]
MMTSLVTKITVGVLAIVIGGGAVVLISYNNRSPRSSSVPPAIAAGSIPMQPIHTAAWYVTHPDVLRQDEKRCADDAASISPAACQNAQSADLQLSINDMKNAAAENAAAGNNRNPKSP